MEGHDCGVWDPGEARPIPGVDLVADIPRPDAGDRNRGEALADGEGVVPSHLVAGEVVPSFSGVEERGEEVGACGVPVPWEEFREMEGAGVVVPHRQVAWFPDLRVMALRPFPLVQAPAHPRGWLPRRPCNFQEGSGRRGPFPRCFPQIPACCSTDRSWAAPDIGRLGKVSRMIVKGEIRAITQGDWTRTAAGSPGD